jgi:hypothetical protein
LIKNNEGNISLVKTNEVQPIVFNAILNEAA